MGSRNKVLFIGITLVLFILLVMLFFIIDNSGSYKNKVKVIDNAIIKYPLFNSDIDDAISDHINNANLYDVAKVDYNIYINGNIVNLLFSYYDENENIISYSTLLFKDKSLIQLTDLYKSENIYTKINEINSKDNLKLTDVQIAKATINYFIHDNYIKFYLCDYNGSNVTVMDVLMADLSTTTTTSITTTITTTVKKEIITKYKVDDEDASIPKYVAFTFDDGPSEYTLSICSVLKQYNFNATFFEVGYYLANRGNVTVEVYNQGFEIGNHTTDHSKLSNLSVSGIQEKINNNNARFQELTGDTMKFVRPPYGSYNYDVKVNAGFPLILWSVDSRDWESRNVSKIKNIVLNEIKDGDIVLFHDLYKTTYEAILEIVPILNSKGYKIMSVGELFALKGKNLEAGNAYYNAR